MVGGLFEQGNQLCSLKETTHKIFGFLRGRTRDCITPDFSQIYRLVSLTIN